MPFNPLTSEELSQLAEPPSLGGRIGMQGANLIPNMATDINRAFFNLGIRDNPTEIPTPYTIPPPKTFAESAIDVGAGIAKSIPLIVATEGAVGGLAGLVGAAPKVASVLGSAAGFGAQGLTEDKTQAALGAGAGALWGLESVVPAKYRLPIAGIIGATSAAENYAQTGSATQAVTQGGINAILPAAFRKIGGFLKGRRVVDKPDAPMVPSDMPPVDPSSLPFQLQREAVVPEGALIRHPTYSEGEALTIAASRERAANAPRVATLQLEGESELPFNRTANGSAEPTQNFQLSNEPELPFARQANGEVRAAKVTSPTDREFPFEGPTAPTTEEFFREPTYSPAEATLFAKGKLEKATGEGMVREPTYSEGEARTISESKAKEAGQSLGLEYQGQAESGHMEFKIPEDAPHPARGSGVTLSPGQTIEDLQAAKSAKMKAYEETPFNPEDAFSMKHSAESLGLEYQGLRPNGRMQFTPKDGGTTFSVKKGGNFNDLKAEFAKATEKRNAQPRMSSEEMRAKLAELRGEKPPEVATSQQTAPEVTPPSPSETPKLKLKPKDEGGYSQQDVVNTITRYVAAPLAGAAIGAAISDPDKRVQNAILFGVGALGLGHISPRLIEAFARSHPDIAKAGSFPAKVKEFAKGATEAVTASERAAAKASKELGAATGFEKIARWLNRRFTTAPDVQRGLDKAHGIVDEVSKVIEKNQLALANKALMPGQLKAIQDYYSGKITETELENLIGNNQISGPAMAIRQSANTLQEIIWQSLPPGKLRDAVKDSFNKYLTETFKIFHDPAYYPSEDAVRKVARMLPGGDMENNVAILRDYLNSIKANRGIYGVTPAKKGYGAALGAILRTKNPVMSKAFEEMLGIYDSPMEQMAATARKLITGARTAEFFNQMAATEKANGLKMAYSYEELSRTREQVATQLSHAKHGNDPTKVATLQQKLDDLNDYVYNAPNQQHGIMSDKFMDRRVHDSLVTYDSILTQSGSPINRAITDVTNAVKYAHTVASPLQFARQVFSMPFLGALAKTGPMDWWKAYHSLFNDPAELSRLRKLGLTYGDTVSGMLRQDFSEMLKGKFDQLVTNRTIRNGIATWEEIYRTPDLITRVAAFQKQEAKLLREGMSAKDAADKAIDFANMFAMNYGMAPKGIQIVRKIPFVNQYLTFAFEMARITKNLTQVAMGGPDPHGIGRAYAAGILTMFATAPLIVQKLTESQLSEKDYHDWKKAEGLLPEYSRSNFKFVTGRDTKGNFHYIDFTPIIIHDKWMKMARDIGNVDWEAFKADNPVLGWENTPLLNVATNQITGVDQHTKESLSTVGQRINSIRRDLLPPLLGTDLDKIVQALTPNASGSLGVTDLRSGKSSSISSIIGSYITSLRDYTVNPSVLEQRAVSEATTQTANARAYFYRVMRSDAASSVKQQAAAYYQTTQKQILMSLRDKLRKETQVDPNQ